MGAGWGESRRRRRMDKGGPWLFSLRMSAATSWQSWSILKPSQKNPPLSGSKFRINLGHFHSIQVISNQSTQWHIQVWKGNWDKLWPSTVWDFLKPPSLVRSRLFFVLQRNPAFKVKTEAGGKDGLLAFGLLVFGLAEHKS